MTSIHAFAPGKLLLIGEYAVLDGASALVMAVDRQVSVKVSHARRRVGCLHAPSLEFGAQPWRSTMAHCAARINRTPVWG